MPEASNLLPFLMGALFTISIFSASASDEQASAVGKWEFKELENFENGDKMKTMLETALSGSVLEISDDLTYDLTLQGEVFEGTYTKSDESHLELTGVDNYSVTLENGLLHMTDSSDASLQYVFAFTGTENISTNEALKATEPGEVYTDRNSVLQVQTALNIAGYDCGTPDGINGKTTVASISKYQKEHSLNVTGTVTEELKNFMRENEFWADLFINADYNSDQPSEVHRSDDFTAHIICYNIEKAPLVNTDFEPYIPFWYKVTQPDGSLLKQHADFGDYTLTGNEWGWVYWYFFTPDLAPTGTATFELYDTDNNLLAKMMYDILP